VFPVIAILMVILFPVLILLTLSAAHHVDELRRHAACQTTLDRRHPTRRLA
jgi:hypothetical protein